MVGELVLPILLGGVLSVWNADSSIRAVQFQGVDRKVETWSLLPSWVERRPIARAGVARIADAPRVKGWVELEGVSFEARAAKREWVVRLTERTGLVLANPVANVLIRFELVTKARSRWTSGLLVAEQSVAFFASRVLFPDDLVGLGEVTLRIWAEEPIAVWATECQEFCAAKVVD